MIGLNKDPLIITRNLTKNYSNGVKANVDINIEINKGEIWGVVGPNGAGKTTLIRQLTGELLPTSGEIWINRIDVVKMPERVKGIIGVCPQEASLFTQLRVSEHIYFFARLKGLKKNEAIERTNNLLECLNLKEHKNKYVGELSGGLKRKVFFALAVAPKAPILFLDEPTTGLDPESRRDVWNFIRSMKKEEDVTILLTTHYMEEAEQLCDNIIIINKGRVIAEGSLEKIRSKLFYDLKLILPASILTSIEGLLKGIDHRLIRIKDRLEVQLKREDEKKIKLIDKILDIGVDAIISQPSLEDIYLEIIRDDNLKSIE